jgi:hypothetical protein
MKLSRFESRWAEAAMDAIFPGSGDMGLSGIRAMNLGGFLRELMVRLPWRAAVGVRLAIWLVALAPWFVLSRFVTIASLEPGDRERVVGALLASESYPIRSLVLVLKAMGALLYAADDGVRLRITRPRSSVTQLRIRRAPA